MRKPLTLRPAIGVLSLIVANSALAQTAPGQPDLPTPEPSESTAAEAGLASPYALSAKVVQGQSWARALGGYDRAAQSFRISSSAESGLTRSLAFRADYDHGPSTSATNRVSFGLKLQLLAQETHGLDLGVGLFYQPNDFRGEGNIVGSLMLGRRFDRVAVLGSVLLGSDPEGDDQEVDGRLGSLIRVGRRLEVGVDGRFRTVLSSDSKRVGRSGIDWEVALLPNANVRLGRIRLIGAAGFTALRATELAGAPEQRKSIRTGIIAMSGLGLGF